jgi:selenide,water dikinase
MWISKGAVAMVASSEIKLTRLAECAGCAAKMGPGQLAEVVRQLTVTHNHPNLLAGIGDGLADDAAVYRLNAEQAIVQTVDFFPPVVDDAYTYGAVAAANAMSDVYAMGGEVLFALNIAAMPESLPRDVVAAIFQGGADKLAEGGGVIAGGHTILDDEPKYGLCVTGIVDPQRVFRKGGARKGDALILTKPLGCGIITTALKRDLIDSDSEAAQAVMASMLHLNMTASRVLRQFGDAIHAVTDVTGFGLLGHAAEMARQSEAVSFVLHTVNLRLLPDVQRLAEAGSLPGGMERNRDFLLGKLDGSAPLVTFERGVSETWQSILFDPETSGGLLCAVDPAQAFQVAGALEEAGEGGQIIGYVRGEVEAAQFGHVQVVTMPPVP